jgi:hypothetical protein
VIEGARTAGAKPVVSETGLNNLGLQNWSLDQQWSRRLSPTWAPFSNGKDFCAPLP